MTENRLEALRRKHELDCIAAISDEGLVMARAGGDEGMDAWAAYAPGVAQAGGRMAREGGLGGIRCSALILSTGRILMLHGTELAGRPGVIALVGRRTPRGLNGMLEEIRAAVDAALGGG